MPTHDTEMAKAMYQALGGCAALGHAGDRLGDGVQAQGRLARHQGSALPRVVGMC